MFLVYLLPTETPYVGSYAIGPQESFYDRHASMLGAFAEIAKAKAKQLEE